MIVEIPMDLSRRRLGKPASFVTYLYTPMNGTTVLSEYHIINGKRKILVLGSYSGRDMTCEKETMRIFLTRIQESCASKIESSILGFYFPKSRV